jgi:hypothetical protein
MRGKENARGGLNKMQLRYILDASKGETEWVIDIMDAGLAAGLKSIFPKG